VFTGLVEEKGVLSRREARGPGARLIVGCAMAPLVLGESIAVDGVCLTVQAIVAGGFACDASSETLQRTTLGDAAVGAAVNLERAMPLGGRMGGHIVTGHVDGAGRLLERGPVGETVKMVFGFPRELARYIAEKGSVAVNGVSLTVNGAGADRFDVVVIPHTLSVTSLGALGVGSRVNIEVDLLARYAARARDIDASNAGKSDDERDEKRDEEWRARLERAGYT